MPIHPFIGGELRPAAGRYVRPCRGGLVMAVACGSFAIVCCGPPALAQVPVTLNGPPIQMRPYVPEPGLPLITITPGTPNPLPGGAGTGGGAGGPGAGGGGGGGGTSGSDPLTTMMGQPWGVQAVSAIESLGVNPSAVAATCVLESGCNTNPSGGPYVGTFQMGTAAFTDGLHTALAANPALASEIVQGDAGRMDPLTAAIATAGYQMQAVQTLESAGLPNPTVLDTRGYFNFGPRYAVGVASAPDSAPMAQVLAGAPADVFTGNAITPGETVGQWRATVSTKIGNAAGESVLT